MGLTSLEPGSPLTSLKVMHACLKRTYEGRLCAISVELAMYNIVEQGMTVPCVTDR